MSGPPPTPTALKILRGNPGKRRLNRHEPKPTPSAIEPPAWLRGDRVALAIWREEAPRLLQLGLLGHVDRLLFAALCERAAVYRRAAKKLRSGLTHKTPGGRIQRPEAHIARAALDGLRQLAGVFGMSPADRSRLMVEPPAGERKSKWHGLVKA